MENMYDKPRLWKKIIRGILYTLTAITLLAAVISSITVRGILNSENCKNAICTEEFDASVEKYVRQCFMASSSVIELSGDRIINDVGVDSITLYAREYTRDYVDALYTGKEFVPKEFDNEAFKKSVYDQMKEFSSGELSDGEIEEIYEEALKTIRSVLQYVPKIAHKLINKVSPFIQRVSILKSLEIPLYFISAILVAVTFAFGGKAHLYDVLFGTASALWITFITLEIPLIILAFYNIPQRIVIGESLFLHFIKGICKVTINDSAVVIGVCLGIITVFLAVSIALISFKRLEQREKEKIYIEKHQKTVDKKEEA